MNGANLIALGCAATLLVAGPSHAIHRTCPPDSARVGPSCVDKYEASVWRIPAANAALIEDVRDGSVTLEQLLAAGAVQYGASVNDYGRACPPTGNGCKSFYAVSIPGVRPSANVTWFQAAAACRNSGKRLPTNQEWQMAALGTPDKPDDGLQRCNVSVAGTTVNTGSRSKCVSDVGAFDLVGNTEEWVADWVPRSNLCTPPLFPETGDSNCMGALDPNGGPGALVRGGDFSYHEWAGVFAIESISNPAFGMNDSIRGFRCAH